MNTAVAILLAERANHIFATRDTCTCGFEPTDENGWYQHIAEAQVVMLARWMRSHTSTKLQGDPFILASDWAADILEGK